MKTLANRVGQVWEEKVERSGETFVFLIIGEEKMYWYRLLNLETGNTTVVIKEVLDGRYNNSLDELGTLIIRWTRIA